MTSISPGWRLLLLRMPDAGGGHVHARLLPHADAPLPVLLETAEDAGSLEPLAQDLTRAGATVALVHAEAGLCAWHPCEFATARCVDCGAWICSTCCFTAAAARCPPCSQRTRRRERFGRLRRLLAIFLFAVFLFELLDYLQAEKAALAPPVRVALFQLVPPHLAYHPTVAALNKPDGWLGRSLLDIEPFFEQEYRRYTASDQDPLTITVFPPWPASIHPPEILAPDLAPWTRAWRGWQHPRYFHALARARGAEPDDFGARAYIVYTDATGDVAGDSRGSQLGRIAVPTISVSETNLGYAVITVAHELAHVLGAKDRYDPDTYLAAWPEGYVQPFTQPTWPQRWGELMAVDIPLSPTTEVEPRSLFMERFGYQSAAEMGWISKEDARTWYIPRLEAPDSVLDAIRRARDRARPVRAAPTPTCSPDTDSISEAEE